MSSGQNIYVRREEVFEAIQNDGTKTGARSVKDWVHSRYGVCYISHDSESVFVLDKKENELCAAEDDWVIYRPQKESFSVMSDYEFQQTYKAYDGVDTEEWIVEFARRTSDILEALTKRVEDLDYQVHTIAPNTK